MLKYLGLATIALAAVVMVATPGAASYSTISSPDIDPEILAELPEDDGREATAMLCTQCHAIGMVTSQRHTREEWDEVIVRMVDMGFYASEEQTEQIADYLAKHFGREANPG